jgi:hypothetical protein
MSKPAFAEAISTLVAKEVRDALAPYQEALASLVEFAGGRPGGTLAATSATASLPKRRGRRAGGVRGGAAFAATASRFVEGQKVQYRQGRGTFDARVVGINAEKGTVTLERTSDQKTVVRPAAKVLAA